MKYNCLSLGQTCTVQVSRSLDLIASPEVRKVLLSAAVLNCASGFGPGRATSAWWPQQVLPGSSLLSGFGGVPLPAAHCVSPLPLPYVRLRKAQKAPEICGGCETQSLLIYFLHLLWFLQHGPERSRSRGTVSGRGCLEPAVSAQPGIGSVRWVSLKKRN